MKLPLRYLGHSDLRTKATPIQEITPDLIQLAEDMIETMVKASDDGSIGVGLAAPQIGRLVRMFVWRSEQTLPDGKFTFDEPEVVINPTLSKPSQETETLAEGCLSVPKLHLEITRPVRIHMRYQNLKGEWIEKDLEGYNARIVMHENDHLNGVLFFDRISAAERKKIEPTLREIKRKFSP